MGDPGERLGPDVEELHTYLRALDSQVRLALLQRLQAPKKASEITVRTADKRGNLSSGRVLSRSTVTEHLGVLEDVSLVRRLPEDGSYVLDRQQLHRCLRGLRRLGELEPVVPTDVEDTIPTAPQDPSSMPTGPKLILVNGPHLGRAFPLEGDGPWEIGRVPEVDIAVTYDPHVSRRHVAVSRGDDGLHRVEALEGATNPARLDFRELAPATPTKLLPGSVLTVGSSRLVFKGV